LPATGTALERVYQGQILRVTVLANGFEYHGKNYASLSAIAHRVTGTRWNVEETPDKTWSKFFPSVEWEKRNTYAYPLPYTDEFCHLYAERFALKARPGALCRV
jgi:hypothetical protein